MPLDLFPDLQCRREFLGWDAPLLSNAAELMAEKFAQNDTLDLGGWICVLPTTLSAQRFTKRLQSVCDRRSLTLVRPNAVTAGDVAELLYRPRKPIAIEFEQTLAWARVLKNYDAESLRALLPVLPESGVITQWMEVAGTLRRLATDLSAHNVGFSSVVDVSETAAEKQRWELLSRLFDSYLNELAAAGLGDRHVERQYAVRTGKVRAKQKVALIGAADLNDSVTAILSKVETEMIALIAAPESHRERFDWIGRLETEGFSKFRLSLRDDQLVPASDLSDQASAAAETVSQFTATRECDEIAVGITDESQLFPLEMELEACDFSTCRNPGFALSSTAVGQLIDRLADFVDRPTWQSLAALVRHGDVHRFLQSKVNAHGEDLLVPLDGLLANHFPVRLHDPLPSKAIEKFGDAIGLRKSVFDWLSPLRQESGPNAPAPEVAENTDFSPFSPNSFAEAAPISRWCGSILEVLDSLYRDLDPASDIHSESESDRETGIDRHRTSEAITKVRELLTRFASLNRQLDVPVTVANAFETLSIRLAELRLTPRRETGQIQISGWLDLALDESPAMVVVGFNHPYVPSAVTNDPFLPGALRTRLRIVDNERRFARDVYATQLMVSTRSDIRFVVGKTSADGSPTPPSRLIASAEPADVARRVRNLLDGERERVRLPNRFDSRLDRSQLPIPEYSGGECPVKTMSVTGFKAYLECPFRFYLRYVLGLKPIDDSARELAANQFGDLVHGAVENFGESKEKDEADEKRIFEALRHHLNAYAETNYGPFTERAVELQIRQAERRLRFVAAEQAERIQAGWRIHATEASVDESSGAAIIVDDRPMWLRGRFDRIDRHLETGQVAILDYKTHGHKPEKKHLRKNRQTGKMEWIDLQLPLYRRMIPFLGLDAEPETVELGYFNVSDKAEETKINIAEFTDEQFEDADRILHECVERIFACDFAPTNQRVLYDDYEMIMQTGVASRMMSGSVASGDDAFPESAAYGGSGFDGGESL